MKRREFLLVSTAGLLATKVAGNAPSNPIGRSLSTPEPDSRIFPIPSDVRVQPGQFDIADDVSILVPVDPPAEALFLARALRDEIADWFGLILKIEQASGLAQNKRA